MQYQVYEKWVKKHSMQRECMTRRGSGMSEISGVVPCDKNGKQEGEAVRRRIWKGYQAPKERKCWIW